MRPWASVGMRGPPLAFVGVHARSWAPMGTACAHGQPWEASAHGKLWVPVGIRGRPWAPTGIHGRARACAALGRLWAPTGNRRHP